MNGRRSASAGIACLAIAVAAGCRERAAASAADDTPPPPRRAAVPTPAPPEPTRTPAPAAAAPLVDPALVARQTRLVEEPRGGRRVRLNVPPQLRLYEDTHRFLAVQMADSRAAGYALPADDAELAALVTRGELVELPAATDDYVLYETGTEVPEDPRVHFDVATGETVRLVPSAAAWQTERASLTSAARGRRRAARAARRELAAVTAWYGDAARADALYAEAAGLSALARDWGGVRYDLDSADDRARFQVRLLSTLRPEAKLVAETLAHDYRARFGRPLPLSSLVRTQRYQRGLRRVNRNATAVEFPPHTTGMAFDISYRFMPPEEQNFLLERIAALKTAGKVEALREPRNSIHVYVLRRGPPSDDAVRAFTELMQETRRPPRRRRRH